jgi:oxygen-independent coproporphyrinogen-3 oxidase
VKEWGIYVHIPFCDYKCPYCDFFSLSHRPIGEDEYVELLIKEAELRAGLKKPSTLYLGGGTPSLLHPKILERLLEGLDKVFDLSLTREITIEANPETLTPEKLKGYLSLGINRLSIGVQSFLEKGLLSLGRKHGPWEAIRAYSFARDAGFENINLDIIWGWHPQREEDLLEDIETATSLDPEHLSFYLLTKYGDGSPERTGEDRVASLYKLLTERLRDSGYIHYEISNWAKEGKECKHNLLYWNRLPYIGLGVSSSGFDGRVRYTNARNIEEYRKKVEGRTLPEAFSETIGEEEAMRERLILGLRLLEGIPSEGVKIPNHLFEFMQTSGGRLSIKEEYMILSNEIISELLVYNSTNEQ